MKSTKGGTEMKERKKIAVMVTFIFLSVVVMMSTSVFAKDSEDKDKMENVAYTNESNTFLENQYLYFDNTGDPLGLYGSYGLWITVSGGSNPGAYLNLESDDGGRAGIKFFQNNPDRVPTNPDTEPELSWVIRARPPNHQLRFQNENYENVLILHQNGLARFYGDIQIDGSITEHLDVNGAIHGESLRGARFEYLVDYSQFDEFEHLQIIHVGTDSPETYMVGAELSAGTHQVDRPYMEFRITGEVDGTEQAITLSHDPLDGPVLNIYDGPAFTTLAPSKLILNRIAGTGPEGTRSLEWDNNNNSFWFSHDAVINGSIRPQEYRSANDQTGVSGDIYVNENCRIQVNDGLITGIFGCNPP